MTEEELFQRYLDARREAFHNPDAFRSLRKELLERNPAKVFGCFRQLLQEQDDEGRCLAVEGIALLYGDESVPALLPCLSDNSPVVRWVACGCLHDFGDGRAVAKLLELLERDVDHQVRGAAANALGRIGAIEAIPKLENASRLDQHVDEQGHTPASYAQEALSEIFRAWVTRRIRGGPDKAFEEHFDTGALFGTVTAEAIPFDAEGRITKTARYRDVPLEAFGYGTSSKLDLKTSIVAPFEVAVAFSSNNCTVERVLVYYPIPGDSECDWAIHTIVDPATLRS